MKHKAIVTIEVDSERTDECEISIVMDPPVSNKQDNFAGGVALRMVQFLKSDVHP